MEKTGLKKLDAVALKNEVAQLKKELFNLKLNMITGQVKDTSQFRKLRVKIAQALTYLNQYENKNKNKNAKA